MIRPAEHVSPDGKWIWLDGEWVPFHDPAPVAWARPYESARFRATIVTVFLVANAAALVFGIVVDLILIAGGADLSTLTDAEALTVGLLLGLYAVALYGTLVPCIVTFCMWVHRVVRNMPALGSSDARWSPSGAVGRSFIPILNLFHPMSGTLEAWRAADPTRYSIDEASRRQMKVPALIVLWWSCWLISRLLGGFSLQLGRNIDPSSLSPALWLDLGNAVLVIGAAVLAVLIVREVTDRQDRKFALIAAGTLS